MNRRVFFQRAFSLIELMCVMTIIAILVSLMLPTLSKALRKAQGVAGHLGGPGGVEMRDEEVIRKYAQYRSDHPAHGKLNRRAFIRELQLSAQAEAWLTLSSVEYRPFASSDPAEQPVIVVYPSGGSGVGIMRIFTVANLMGK